MSNCPNFGDKCYLMFDYLGDMDDLVILGMPFLRSVMGVFNWDEKTVSCEFLSPW
jgi:saccharopepsin